MIQFNGLPEEKACYQIHVNKICGLRPARSSTIECYVAAKVQEGDEFYERKSDRTKGSSDFEWQQNLERMDLRPSSLLQFQVRMPTSKLRRQRRVLATTCAYPLSELADLQGGELKPRVYIELPLMTVDGNSEYAGTININVRTIIRDTGKEVKDMLERERSRTPTTPSSSRTSESMDGPPSPVSSRTSVSDDCESPPISPILSQPGPGIPIISLSIPEESESGIEARLLSSS